MNIKKLLFKKNLFMIIFFISIFFFIISNMSVVLAGDVFQCSDLFFVTSQKDATKLMDYDVLNDTCQGYRCMITSNHLGFTSACYDYNQCNDNCGGYCVKIDVLKEGCGFGKTNFLFLRNRNGLFWTNTNAFLKVKKSVKEEVVNNDDTINDNQNTSDDEYVIHQDDDSKNYAVINEDLILITEKEPDAREKYVQRKIHDQLNMNPSFYLNKDVGLTSYKPQGIAIYLHINDALIIVGDDVDSSKMLNVFTISALLAAEKYSVKRVLFSELTCNDLLKQSLGEDCGSYIVKEVIKKEIINKTNNQTSELINSSINSTTNSENKVKEELKTQKNQNDLNNNLEQNYSVDAFKSGLDKRKNDCNGCLIDFNFCMPLNRRINKTSYCGDNKEVKPVKPLGEPCNYSLECKNYSCIDEICKKPSVLQTIVDYFRMIFGFSPNHIFVDDEYLD